MSWRFLTSGPMVEVVGGLALPGQKQPSQTVIAHEGGLVESPRDLSEDMKKRYEAGDPYMRALVEYGDVEVTNDDEGNPVKTFVPKGVPSDLSGPDDNPDAVARAEAAEGESTQLKSRVAELEDQVGTLQAEALAASSTAGANAQAAQERAEELEKQVEAEKERADAAEALYANALSYSDLTPEALEVEVAQKKLSVTGTGANGNILKKDNIQALEAARSAS